MQTARRFIFYDDNLRKGRRWKIIEIVVNAITKRVRNKKSLGRESDIVEPRRKLLIVFHFKNTSAFNGAYWDFYLIIIEEIFLHNYYSNISHEILLKFRSQKLSLTLSKMIRIISKNTLECWFSKKSTTARIASRFTAIKKRV